MMPAITLYVELIMNKEETYSLPFVEDDPHNSLEHDESLPNFVQFSKPSSYVFRPKLVTDLGFKTISG